MMASGESISVQAFFPSDRFTLGAGVAIFHLATARVVLCYHTRKHYWFLPKGRKNIHENMSLAASREGFEESGYRNRPLPIPFAHRQTPSDAGPERYVTEAISIHLRPLSQHVQYLAFWHIAETLPPQLEQDFVYDPSKPYEDPPAFPRGTTLAQRIALDQPDPLTGKPYEPVHYEATGVNEDEECYESFLLPIDEALTKLNGTTTGMVMSEVITRGWQGIQLRMKEEAELQ